MPKEHKNQPAAARRCTSLEMEVGPDKEARLLEEDGPDKEVCLLEEIGRDKEMHLLEEFGEIGWDEEMHLLEVVGPDEGQMRRYGCTSLRRLVQTRAGQGGMPPRGDQAVQ